MPALAPADRGLRPGVLKALDRLLHDATAGDPITGLLWTHRSMRKLAKALRSPGHQVSPNTIARLLHDAGFSLRTNRKQLAEVTDPDRDRQFRYLTRLRRLYISHGLPVISVDTKKKELIGPYKNPGKTWRRKPQVSWRTISPVMRWERPSLMGSMTRRTTLGWWSWGRRTRHQHSPWRVSAAGGSWRGRKRYAGASVC